MQNVTWEVHKFKNTIFDHQTKISTQKVTLKGHKVRKIELRKYR